MRTGCDMDIAGALRALRLEAGLTQTQLAGALGKPQSFVSKLEAGTRQLRFSEAPAYAEALGATMDGLVEAARRE